MLETNNTIIKRIVETEGVKYEIYIPQTDQPAVLLYLEESSFLSLVKTIQEAFEYANKGEEVTHV
ncbi:MULTISPECIES: hypothetical protein [Leptospira]|uniref:hypothetical protein n=1 Tax=Leptospira TaxID=171 RepID=UPI0002BF8F77|nr:MULTISPECIES: hypothetical protein [Leptospira]EMK10132.1 hypothetical protein LEP1GSC066_0715 [Leptospira sp. serovar Kenya str. Sh9]